MNIDERDFYRQATKQICSSLDLETSLHQCLVYLRDFLPASQIGVTIYEPELGALRLIAHATPDGGLKDDDILPLSADARNFLESLKLPYMRINNYIMSDPIGKWFVKNQFIPSDNYSFMLAYLHVESKWIGNLYVATEGQGQYNEEHLHLFSQLQDPFVISISNALRYQEIKKLKDMLVEETRFLLSELHQSLDDEIVGHGSGLKMVMDMVQEIAPRESPVLLLGETGVGKDIIAQAIHNSSPRRDGPFVKVNCGAIPDTLLDSELFGHEKGAFTGATEKKIGRFERADNGTIFLDEIGELPAHAQVRLLRVLQDKEIERVGGTKPITLNIRVIAATNRDLEQMIKENLFRQDLWFRLQVFPVKIPPLRNRKEDIPAFVHYFIQQKARELKVYPTPILARGVMTRLLAYPWPGNVRELENLVERAIILSKGKPLTFNELAANDVFEPSPQNRLPTGESLELDHVVANHIRSVLDLCKGRISGPHGAAAILGIHHNTLRHRMMKLGVPFGPKKRF